MKNSQNNKNGKKKNSSKRELYLIATIALAIIVVGVGLGFMVDRGQDEGLLKGKHYVQFEIEDYGTIIAELDAEIAPVTVTNFVNLVEAGFYDGLTFHRIISGFMIQGGDPLGNGTGGSGQNIKGEFQSNGVANNLKHERGVVSMARSMAKDSASSQFFIMHEDAPHLDGEYAAFGRVISGMEVVDAICETVPVTDNNGTVEKTNQPVMSSVKIISKPEN